MRQRPPRPQDVVRTALPLVLDAEVRLEVCPEWLRRPGRAECGNAWDVLCDIYRALTGTALPDAAPTRERRRVDAVVRYPDGAQQIVEVDERQHFTRARATTLELYPPATVLGFPRDVWLATSVRFAGREPGGGFAKPRPPLFPGPGGRHAQRAFRDALADLLPAEHGWLPTVRISEFELASWSPTTVRDELAELLAARRVIPARYVHG